MPAPSVGATLTAQANVREREAAMALHTVPLDGGVALTVEDEGAGHPIVFLHAGVSTRNMWDRQWGWLGHGFRVIRWDWRGFGDTPHVPGPYSYLDDLTRVLDALELPPVTIVGCSFGGGVALHLAEEHPERVERLALVASGLPGWEGETPPDVGALFSQLEEAFGENDIPRALDLMERLWLIGPRRTREDVDPRYLSEARALLERADRPDNGAVSRDRGWSALPLLDSLAVPVLVVAGSEDVPSVLDGGHAIADRVPGARMAVIDGAAHLPNMERPRHFDAILADWLAETAAHR